MGRPAVTILSCVNAGYMQHLAACLVSLLANNPDKFFDVVVVHTGELGDAEDRLRRTLAPYDRMAFKLVPFAIPSASDLPLRAHYTLDIYTRLWIADFFPQGVDRVLYLDADMIVVGSIDELWGADLAGNILGAVTIPNSDRGAHLGLPPEYAYFNSGVMLVDLAAWRREGMADRVFEYIRANPDKLIDPDQDALNACLYDRRLPLDYAWNVISPFYSPSNSLAIPDMDRDAAVRNARIVHFNGASKPWSYLCRHPRKADYYAYLSRTDWRDFRPPDRNPLNWIKRNIWHHISVGLRDRATDNRRAGDLAASGTNGPMSAGSAT